MTLGEGKLESEGGCITGHVLLTSPPFISLILL